jgi:hypothetical protein
MEKNYQEIRHEVLKGPLVDKFIKACYRIHNDGLIKIWPSGCTTFAEYRNHAQRVRHLAVRQDDVWIITHPKSGVCTIRRSQGAHTDSFPSHEAHSSHSLDAGLAEVAYQHTGIGSKAYLGSFITDMHRTGSLNQ